VFCGHYALTSVGLPVLLNGPEPTTTRCIQMSQRVDFMKQSPDLTKKLVELDSLFRKSSIEEAIQDLVTIRASQMNGCAFCVAMHTKQATIHDERPFRIHHLPAWRESTLFRPRERASLAWTEVLTRLPDQGVPT